MAYGDPEQSKRKAEHQQCHEYDAGNQVPVGQGQGPRLGQLARDKNNMHAAPLLGPHSIRRTRTPMKNPYAFLDQPDGIAPLMPQARRLIELREILAAVLPESLARCCSIANFKQGKVVIFAANGAIAAKLKLMLPTLLEQLSKRAIEVTGLEVCVQPLASDRQLVEKSAKMSVEAVSWLARLCEQLPDSELKITLVKIAARHRK